MDQRKAAVAHELQEPAAVEDVVAPPHAEYPRLNACMHQIVCNRSAG